jgi:hypothetical protein
MSEPQVHFANQLTMNESLDGAKTWVPRAEWNEIKEYVDKSDYDDLKIDALKLAQAIDDFAYASSSDLDQYKKSACRDILEEWRKKYGVSK